MLRMAPQARERLGVEGLIDVVRARWRGRGLDEDGLDGVLADVEARAGEPVADDVAIVTVTSPGDAYTRLNASWHTHASRSQASSPACSATSGSGSRSIDPSWSSTVPTRSVVSPPVTRSATSPSGCSTPAAR